ncbi:MAG: hypothetical protein JWN86_2465 [Planctomycetota bacterium]|nr:hypothetical protein [Planctomycetota bacterium]
MQAILNASPREIAHRRGHRGTVPKVLAPACDPRPSRRSPNASERVGPTPQESRGREALGSSRGARGSRPTRERASRSREPVSHRVPESEHSGQLWPPVRGRQGQVAVDRRGKSRPACRPISRRLTKGRHRIETRSVGPTRPPRDGEAGLPIDRDVRGRSGKHACRTIHGGIIATTNRHRGLLRILADCARQGEMRPYASRIGAVLRGAIVLALSRLWNLC